jgi:hypothetical protein
MNANVSAYLHFYGVLIAIVRPSVVAALLLGLWVALSRTTMTRRERAATWLAVAVPLVLWFAGIWSAAARGMLQGPRGAVSSLPLLVVTPVVVGLFGLTRSRRIAAAVEAAPVSWLIALQVYRVMGANFVVLWLFGVIPGVFAEPAGFGDIAVGVLAMPAALYAASVRRGATAVAVAWNVLGIADLLNALTLGFLSSPGRFQLFAFDRPNVAVGSYPTVMTPAFAVPLSLVLHGLSLWQLHRRSRRQQGNQSAEPLSSPMRA